MRKESSAQLAHEIRLTSQCPVMSSLTLLRGRWKLPIIWRMRDEALSLADLRRNFIVASEKMLSQHLSELLEDGFIHRLPSKPASRRVVYELTALGRSLLPTLENLRMWGESNQVTHLASERLKAGY